MRVYGVLERMHRVRIAARALGTGPDGVRTYCSIIRGQKSKHFIGISLPEWASL